MLSERRGPKTGLPRGEGILTALPVPSAMRGVEHVVGDVLIRPGGQHLIRAPRRWVGEKLLLIARTNTGARGLPALSVTR